MPCSQVVEVPNGNASRRADAPTPRAGRAKDSLLARMLTAALPSACAVWPQEMHWNNAWVLQFALSTSPHAAPVCDVWAGFTFTGCPALQDRCCSSRSRLEAGTSRSSPDFCFTFLSGASVVPLALRSCPSDSGPLQPPYGPCWPCAGCALVCGGLPCDRPAERATERCPAAGGEPHYPLIPVRAMPWTNTFCRKKNSSTMGRVIITDAAISKPHSRPYWELYSYRPRDRV